MERPRGVSSAYPVRQNQGEPGAQTGPGARFRAGEYGGRQGARGVAAGQVVNGPASGLASRQPEGYTAQVMTGTEPKAIVRELAQYTGRAVPGANHPLYKGNKAALTIAERVVVPVESGGGNGGRLAESKGEIGNGAVGRVGKASGSAGTGKAITVEYGEQFTKVHGKKALKPNVEYSTNEGYTFTTDSNGRISLAEAQLELGKADRNSYAQRTIGGEDRLPNDDGGHLIASIFKGSGSIDNLVPMNSTLNRSEYKLLEYTWKKALKKEKEVKVKIEPIYQENSMRPTKFKIDYSIDGKAYSERLTN